MYYQGIVQAGAPRAVSRGPASHLAPRKGQTPRVTGHRATASDSPGAPQSALNFFVLLLLNVTTRDTGVLRSRLGCRRAKGDKLGPSHTGRAEAEATGPARTCPPGASLLAFRRLSLQAVAAPCV